MINLLEHIWLYWRCYFSLQCWTIDKDLSPSYFSLPSIMITCHVCVLEPTSFTNNNKCEGWVVDSNLYFGLNASPSFSTLFPFVSKHFLQFIQTSSLRLQHPVYSCRYHHPFVQSYWSNNTIWTNWLKSLLLLLQSLTTCGFLFRNPQNHYIIVKFFLYILEFI